MHKYMLLVAALCATTGFYSCKDDTEEDLDNGTSSIEDVYINEVCSSGTDWVEIYNASDKDVVLDGCYLQDSKGAEEEYMMPKGTTVPAKGFLVLEKDASFQFGIGSKGDEIHLLDTQHNEIDKAIVPALEEGMTYARTTNGGSEWKTNAVATKGTDNSTAPSVPESTTVAVVINEVYTFSDQTDIKDLDYIELYNTSDKETDLSGFKLWEGGGQAEAWTIPAGTKIAAKGFLTIECDKEGLHKDPTHYPAWGLSKNKETIVFADANAKVIDQVETPNMTVGETYGRKTDGSKEWVIFAETTKGKSNNGAKEKSVLNNAYGVYVNEVFTNNQDADDPKTAWDESKDFIELYNATDKDVDISGFSLNDDAMKEEKRYTFPAGTIVKAKSFLTLDVYKGNTNGPVFGLGKGGDKVMFFDKNKTKFEEVSTPEFGDTDIRSYGRATDGGSELKVFSEISKNASNNGKK